MKNLLTIAILFSGIVLLLILGSGCVVRTYSTGVYPHCQEVWIYPHYDARGYWHPGHWRCRDVVEFVEPLPQ